MIVFLKKFTLALFTMHCFFATTVNSQNSNPIFNHLSIEHGLPGANIHSIFQDSKGIMWFGIESVGLCKYDGYSYTIFSHDEKDIYSISDNNILCIIEDSLNNLWVGTSMGLNKFDRKNKSFTQFIFSKDSVNSITNNHINDLFVDSNNNLWIATQDGLSRYIQSQNKFISLNFNNDTINQDSIEINTNCLFEDSSGNIWIGSANTGLYLVDKKTNQYRDLNNSTFKITDHWLPNNNSDEQPNYSIFDICEYDSENLLVAKSNGLYLFNTNLKQFSLFNIDAAPGVGGSSIRVLLRDNYDKIWVGLTTRGLVIIDTKNKTQHYINSESNELKGIRSNSIRSLFQDQTGQIWIGTKFHGINTYDYRQELFNQHSYNPELHPYLSNKFILTLLEDSKKNIWIGTKHDGLYIFDPQSSNVRHILLDNLEFNCNLNNRIESIEEDIKKNIWVGTENGLIKFNSQLTEYKCYNNEFIRCLESDKYGNVWIGTQNYGLFYYNVASDTVTRFHSDIAFFLDKKSAIRNIKCTSDSLLWFSTYNEGLYKYNLNQKTLIHYTTNANNPNSISDNSTRGVLEDDDGKIWIGTKSGGVNIYNVYKGTFNSFETSPTSVFCIQQDNNNDYWLGTHLGISKIEKNTSIFSSFDSKYGIKSSIIESKANLLTSDGLLIFGGSNGLNVFDPNKVKKENITPPIIITGIKAYDKLIDEDVDTHNVYEFDYHENFISISFALTDYSIPNNTHYKYRLINFDTDWVNNNNRNYATYTSLPPGKYTFQVMASNSDNYWLEPPLSIEIIITVPIWQRTYFIVLAVITILLLFVFFYRIYLINKNEKKLRDVVEEKTKELKVANSKLDKRSSNLEKIVESRTKELEEARQQAIEANQRKTDYLANMSHEIRTPLNAIIGLTDVLIEEMRSANIEINMGEMIQTNATSLLYLLNDIIDISKIEADQIIIQKETFPVNKCITDIMKMYQNQVHHIKKFMKANLVSELPNNEHYIYSDQVRFEQILKNLINNAIKFTHEGSIKVGYKHNINDNGTTVLQFYVEDTGIGIPKNDINDVFVRFKKNQSKSNISHGGKGLGLTISYNLCCLLGGKMWVKSTDGKGSIFYFELPYEESETKTDPKKAERTKNNKHNWQERRVLIAEDIEENYLVLEAILRKTKIKIVRVKDGSEAIQEVLSNDNSYFDIILMDILMPNIDGIIATKEIKKHNKNLIVIAQTAYTMNFDEEKLKQMGFDDYIAKPIKKDVLLRKMSYFINNK